MCLIAIAWRAHPRYPLVLVANRDEAFGRPTAPLDFWDDAPGLLAGRDLRDGGTWLGVEHRGRLAAVTNVRQTPAEPARRSRGSLTVDFLLGQRSATAHAQALLADAADYGPFNLLLWDRVELVYVSNRPQPRCRRLGAGVHALSNGDIEANWPKMRRARALLEGWIERGDDDPAPLFAAFADPRPAPDAELPHTGLAPEDERALSAMFIDRPGYGTRSTSFVAIDAAGVRMLECSYPSRLLRERRLCLSAGADRRPPE